MQPSTLLAILAVGASSVSAGPHHLVTRQAEAGGINPLVAAMLKDTFEEPLEAGFPKDFGLSPGITPCTGSRTVQAKGKAIDIPCECPPAPNDPNFRAAVKIALNQGFFPEPAQTIVKEMNITQWNTLSFTDPNAIKLRNNAMTVAFQSLTGVKGKGCPAASAPVLGGSG